MGIKHSVVKQPDEIGYSYEWNDEHIIDSDINFNGFSLINLGEPINPSDAATKNYVDESIPSSLSGQAEFTSIFLGTSWEDLATVTIDISSGQKVFVMFSCNYAMSIEYAYMNIQLTRDGLAIGRERRGSSSDIFNVKTFALQFIDSPGGGTFTYAVKGRTSESGPNNWLNEGILTVFVL